MLDFFKFKKDTPPENTRQFEAQLRKTLGSDIYRKIVDLKNGITISKTKTRREAISTEDNNLINQILSVVNDNFPNISASMLESFIRTGNIGSRTPEQQNRNINNIQD